MSHEHHDQEEPLDVVQSSETPIDPQEILEMKLNNPETVLTSNQSITLVNHCADLGEQNATTAHNKVTCLVLGITGAGKSAFLNGVMGCKLKLADPEELGLDGIDEVVIVDPDSPRTEIMPIGHGDSKTFIPKIAQDPDNPNRAYCDCPGFSDTRGEEINIANAINIKRVLQQARGTKAVFLAEYSDLTGNRGKNINAMKKMCEEMFGGEEIGINNLRRYQNAVLLGITKAPIYSGSKPLTCDIIRRLLTRAKNPIVEILANRLFLFDPLDRAADNPDFWSLGRCRDEIAQLETIPQHEATALFQTALTGDDEKKLKLIMRDQATKLAQALERVDYQAAGEHWQSLARLKVIGDDEVEKTLEELAGLPLKNFVLRRVSAYTKEALQYNFSEAEQQPALLKMLANHFPNTDLGISLEHLESLLALNREKKAEEQRAIDQKIAAAGRDGVEKVREETEPITQQMLEQLETIIQQMGISESEKQRIRAMANEGRNRILE